MSCNKQRCEHELSYPSFSSSCQFISSHSIPFDAFVSHAVSSRANLMLSYINPCRLTPSHPSHSTLCHRLPAHFQHTTNSAREMCAGQVGECTYCFSASSPRFLRLAARIGAVAIIARCLSNAVSNSSRRLFSCGGPNGLLKGAPVLLVEPALLVGSSLIVGLSLLVSPLLLGKRELLRLATLAVRRGAYLRIACSLSTFACNDSPVFLSCSGVGGLLKEVRGALVGRRLLRAAAHLIEKDYLRSVFAKEMVKP